MRVVGLLALVVLGGCIADPTQSQPDPALENPGRPISALTDQEYLDTCIAVEHTAVGSVLRTCETVAAMATVLRFRDDSCEALRDECLEEIEGNINTTCAEESQFERRRCDEPVQRWIECAEARAAALSRLSGRFQCNRLSELTEDDIARVREDFRAPAVCEAFTDACPQGFEPEPEPEFREPDPIEPDPVEPPQVVYDTLLLFDQGAFDDGMGTSGADFCGVSADCAQAVSAVLILGEGEVCQAEGPGCSANRADAAAILDDGSQCDLASVPSDYVSVGGSGSIAVQFDGDLRSCVVTVVEFAGANPEGWEAYVCDSDEVSVANCLARDEAVHFEPEGGEASFVVPAE